MTQDKKIFNGGHGVAHKGHQMGQNAFIMVNLQFCTGKRGTGHVEWNWNGRYINYCNTLEATNHTGGHGVAHDGQQESQNGQYCQFNVQSHLSWQAVCSITRGVDWYWWVETWSPKNYQEGQDGSLMDPNMIQWIPLITNLVLTKFLNF